MFCYPQLWTIMLSIVTANSDVVDNHEQCAQHIYSRLQPEQAHEQAQSSWLCTKRLLRSENRCIRGCTFKEMTEFAWKICSFRNRTRQTRTPSAISPGIRAEFIFKDGNLSKTGKLVLIHWVVKPRLFRLKLFRQNDGKFFLNLCQTDKS